MQFLQRDPRWAAGLLGSSDITIGKAGCLVTAAATMMSDWGAATDPGGGERLAPVSRRLRERQFVGVQNPAGLGAQCVGYVDCKAVPAPVTRMRDALSAGNVVLAAPSGAQVAQCRAIGCAFWRWTSATVR